jgi:outer membrane protein OmpU
MNKLTKIGASALCGSLATISAANAGELGVTGGVDITWISLDAANTGNPIGIGSNLTFSGSGELDNGWSVGLTVAHTNANVYSNTNVVVGIPGMGSVRIDQGTTGTGIDRMDDMTPAVWEEAWGTGLGTGLDLVAGVSGAANIEFTPEAGMMPGGMTARVAYTPSTCGGASTADKAGSGVCTGVGASGYDVTLSASDELHGIAGLSVFAGISRSEQYQDTAAYNSDKEEETYGFTYAMGGFTFGYQLSDEDLGRATGATKYENTAYGITFSVNDSLSVGYNNFESEQSNSGGNVTGEAASIQAAYTMGGATITVAEAEMDNSKYQSGTNTEATTIKLALAF